MSERFKVTPFPPKPLVWWKANRSKVDWNPPYQRRGRLWSTTDKAYLIDSILNDYDVPKLYVADFTWGQSKLNIKALPYAIIDGKQRFEAIFDFFDGNIFLNDDFSYIQVPALKLRGLGYSDLQKNHPDVAEQFDTASLSVMSVFAEDVERINDLFIRLNRSKPLTGAEIRNAMTGPATEIFRNIAKHEFFHSNIRFNVSRGADLNAAAKLVLFEYTQSPQESKKKNLDKFAEESSEDKQKLELAARRVIDVLDRMSEIFLPKDSLLGSAGLLPVYFWFLRETNTKLDSRIRAFLVDLEEQRRDNKKLVQESGLSSKEIDSELTQFDRFNRSTNDLQSHQGRVEFLQKRFSLYIKSKRKSSR